MRLLGERIEEAALGPGGQDYKTRLQELAARRFEQLPRYEVLDDGPDHAKRFYASVSVGGSVRGRGEGRSKKQAEQGAARRAWEALNAVLDGSGPPPAAAVVAGGAVGPMADGLGTAGAENGSDGSGAPATEPLA
jgi:ribonuclease-3